MIIGRDKSIIPACDVPEDKLEELVKATADIPEIGGYKLGMVVALSVGLPRVVEMVRRYTDKPILYDHQKAATDIPDTGHPFARVCKQAGIDAVILFPQAGPVTEAAWIRAAKEEGLGVIVGGLMTHQAYTLGEGGYICDQSVLDMYLNAVKEGVTDFVVPGTKIEAIHKIREMLEHEGIAPTFYSPGLIKQGGDIRAVCAAAGERWHAFIGRALYNAPNIRKAAEELVKCLC
jgi:orotidine-5'-phosphate decarboxylase